MLHAAAGDAGAGAGIGSGRVALLAGPHMRLVGRLIEAGAGVRQRDQPVDPSAPRVDAVVGLPAPHLLAASALQLVGVTLKGRAGVGLGHEAGWHGSLPRWRSPSDASP